MEEKLLKQLVEIPSYLDKKRGVSERKYGNFIKKFFQINFKNYNITSLRLEDKRENLLILPRKPLAIFCCHLDTVLPSQKSVTKLVIKGDKAYGLGTKDMKGGTVSAILATLEVSKEQQDKVGFLFYCDEEYNQGGMELMVKKYLKIPKSVKYFISPESRFNLSYGCRGYTCVNVIVRGKRASTARPDQGVDAGKNLIQAYEELQKHFSKIKTELGRTSVTLTNLKVGVLVDGECQRQDNAVPDYAEGSISIRLSKNIPRKEIVRIFEDKIRKIHTLPFSIKLKSWRSPSAVLHKKYLRFFLSSAKETGFSITLSNPGLSGYNDVAMISAKTGIPFVNFGPYGEGNHGPDEYVSLKSIKDTKDVFKKILYYL